MLGFYYRLYQEILGSLSSLTISSNGLIKEYPAVFFGAHGR
jgi:hypothetical protein